MQLNILLVPDGAVELLPEKSSYMEVLEQGPFYKAKISDIWQLHWSSASYHLLEVNEYATALAGHEVKGDACLVSNNPSCNLDELLNETPLIGSPYSGRGWTAADCKTHVTSKQRISYSSKQSLAAYLARQALRTANKQLRSPPHSSSIQQPSTPPLQPTFQPVPLPPPVTSAPQAETAAPSRLAGKRCRSLPRVQSAHKIQHRILHSRNCWPEPPACTAPDDVTPQQEEQQQAAAPKPEDEDAMFVMEDIASPWHSQQQQQQQEEQPYISTTELCHLTDDNITHVALQLAPAVSSVSSLANSCSSFRRAITSSQPLLRELRFSTHPAKPFKHHQRCCSTAAIRPLAGCKRLSSYPLLLRNAAAAGNVSAQVMLARLLDAAGAPEEALKQWRASAKGGSAEGQLRLGLALYKGSAGGMQDPEDAHLWLNRALKQALAPHESGMSAELARSVVAQAGLVLGYQHFDGEGCRVSHGDALRCFKLAAGAGCREAEEVIGWMFNTGQYG